LWHKEQQHCFTEVTKNGNNSKGHSSKVAKRIANKNTGWVPEK
jgi:hypothetical protein